jgi:hypothetical protein
MFDQILKVKIISPILQDRGFDFKIRNYAFDHLEPLSSPMFLVEFMLLNL